jgi:hypothetical protein
LDPNITGTAVSQQAVSFTTITSKPDKRRRNDCKHKQTETWLGINELFKLDECFAIPSLIANATLQLVLAVRRAQETWDAILTCADPLGAAAGAVEAGVVQEADGALLQVRMRLLHARVARRHLQASRIIIAEKRSTTQTKGILTNYKDQNIEISIGPSLRPGSRAPTWL